MWVSSYLENIWKAHKTSTTFLLYLVQVWPTLLENANVI